jgi:uncharacterized membrane protein
MATAKHVKAMNLERFPSALERADRLDVVSAPVGSVASAVVPEGPVRRVLRGEWLGHPLHPLLTDLPIGFWTSATVLDLVGGRRARPAATTMVGLGVLSAVPTVASGLAEYTTLDRGQRRVAVVHAAANAVATALYARSWSARRRDRHAAGVAFAMAGMGVATIGGYLGGHLSFASGEEDAGAGEARETATGAHAA